MNNIYSLTPLGSGVEIVHKTLEKNLDNYRYETLSPTRASFPYLLKNINIPEYIIHSTPDMGVSFVTQDKKLVTTFHNYYLDPFMLHHSSFFQGAFYRTFLSHYIKQSLKRADIVTAVSCSTADLIRQHSGYTGVIEIISNGVDNTTFFPHERERTQQCQILFAGNFIQRKGAKTILNLAQRFNGTARLTIAGGLRGKAKHTADNVTFLPRIEYEKMPDVYRDADIFLFPTIREGMSLVMLEAMASGLPVVTYDIPSQRELIDQGKGGFLCPLGDEQSLIQAIDKLVKNPEMRREMGSYNRQKVLCQFRLQSQLVHYQDIFKALR